MNIDIKKKTVGLDDDGQKLDPPIELYTISLTLPSVSGGIVWSETFGSKLEVMRFMRGVEAGRAMAGDLSPLRFYIPD